MIRILALLLALGGLISQAQTPLGTVTGLATDPSGSAVAGASVILTNRDTGVKLSSQTNQSGAYSFLNLPPASYTLAAEAPGFKKIEVETFAVGAFRTLRQDLKFEV